MQISVKLQIGHGARHHAACGCLAGERGPLYLTRIYLTTSRPAQAGHTTDLVPTDRGATFAPVTCDHPCAKCDLEREDCMKVGMSMECVTREPDTRELLWYNMQHGFCNITESTPTHLAFSARFDSGVSFTNKPYTYVLYPRDVASRSQMSNYLGKALALSLHPADTDPLYYIGSMSSVQDDGVGVLMGVRLGGSGDAAVGQWVPCVLDTVKDIDHESAVAVGECTYSGDGRIDVAVEGSRIITGAGEISESTDLAKFKGVNAGSIDESGDYEIFKISEITATGMSGITYFSTRPETWSAGLVDGVEHVERCGVFVDMD